MCSMVYLVLTLIFALVTPQIGAGVQSNNTDIVEYFELLARTGALESHPLIKYVASVKYKTHETSYPNRHICAGLIITERTIATAAHCLMKGDSMDLMDPEELAVAAGFNMDTFDDDKVQELPVSTIVIYPYYDPTTKEHDLALVVTEGSFKIIGGRLELALVRDLPVMPYKTCSVLGFGIANYKETKLTQILEEEVKLWPQNICSLYLEHNGWDLEGRFCAGAYEGVKSGMECLDVICEPIFCDGNAFGLLVINIGCSLSNGYTGIFLHLPSYMEWLASHVEVQVLMSASRTLDCLSKIIAIVVGVSLLLWPGVFVMAHRISFWH